MSPELLATLITLSSSGLVLAISSFIFIRVQLAQFEIRMRHLESYASESGPQKDRAIKALEAIGGDIKHIKESIDMLKSDIHELKKDSEREINNIYAMNPELRKAVK